MHNLKVLGAITHSLTLSKKLFPVSRVGEKKPVGRSGIFFFPNFIFFYKLEYTGGGGDKKNRENREKKVPVGPF